MVFKPTSEGKLKVPQDLMKFASDGVNAFDGMLNKSAAVGSALAAHVLGVDHGWDGKAFLEIGVYKGKFFALIEQATRGTDARLVGVDPFHLDGQSYEDVIQALRQGGLDMTRVHLHKGLSSERTAIEGLISGRDLLLVHIDGSHQEKDVYADLHMIDEMVSDEGIVIADDFWNRNALGIMSAVSRVLIENQINLTPFALVNTKLFWCRSGREKTIRERFIEAFRANTNMEMFADFVRKLDTEERWLTQQEFLGRQVLVI